MTRETRYAKTADGVYIAYQVVGSGPVDFAADFHAFAGNVDLIWDEPDWGPLLLGFTEFVRLILHDRRGSGASTRNVPPPNLETRAADLLTVLDEIGSEAPVLGAAASTGAMHALFAATLSQPDVGAGLELPARAARLGPRLSLGARARDVRSRARADGELGHDRIRPRARARPGGPARRDLARRTAYAHGRRGAHAALCARDPEYREPRRRRGSDPDPVADGRARHSPGACMRRRRSSSATPTRGPKWRRPSTSPH